MRTHAKAVFPSIDPLNDAESIESDTLYKPFAGTASAVYIPQRGNG